MKFISERFKILIFRAEEEAVLVPGAHVRCLAVLKIVSRRVRPPQKMFDLLLVTSARALPADWKGKIRAREILVVGEQTAERLGLRGSRVHILQGKDSNLEGVYRWLRAKKKRMPRTARLSILFPRSARGNKEAIERLRDLGYQITARITYGVELCPPRAESITDFVPDGVIFTSPSTVEAVKKTAWFKSLRSGGAPKIFGMLGPATEKALRSHGLRPLLKAPSISVEALGTAMVSWLKRHS